MSDNDSQNRLDTFQDEVDKLGVSGGLANPEKTLANLGAIMLVVGGFFTLIWAFTKRGNPGVSDTNEQLVEVIHANNNIWIGLFGIALILLGQALYLRNSMTRYLRYWLTRMIYEERANTDRMIAALENRD